MEKFEGGGDINQSSNLQNPNQLDPKPTGDAVFDASQYAFFSSNVVDEVELGGLEDEDDYIPRSVFVDDENQPVGVEAEDLRTLTEVDDLVCTFSKLSKGPLNSGYIGDGPSRENSSIAEWAQDGDFPNSVDQPHFDEDLYRASSYPVQGYHHPPPPHNHHHHHHYYSCEPILIQKSPFTSFPPPSDRSHQASSSNSPYQLSNISYHSVGMPPLCSSNLSHFSIQHGSNFIYHTINSRIQNPLSNNVGVYHGDHSDYFIPQNLPHRNGLLPQHMPHHQFGLQSQLSNQHMINNLDMIELGDVRDPWIRSTVRGVLRVSSGLDISSYKNENGRPRFRSMYMSSDEMENILRMQLAATHSNDPYTDDYYHQACLAKRTSGSQLRHHFCPTSLRDGGGPSTARANQSHPFLQVNALGRVSFSSVRRPRPLLEFDPSNSSGSFKTEQNLIEKKTLEQEPMLVARAVIENGLRLLLDVDDIDRFLQFNQLPDCGVRLRERRQALLERVATSLHVIDPLDKTGYSVNTGHEDDDLIFLRLLSLSKGRKLVSKYIKLLSQGDDELVRVISMAILRHLRFLFCAAFHDDDDHNLSETVSFRVNQMDLKSLSACLASVVCSPEPPPLRPIGTSSGHGVSLILKSLLQRAAEILRDRNSTTDNCSVHTVSFWQASFNAFFGLLIKYCFNKYDTVMQSPSDTSAAMVISREMPVEVLRASLPHTNEEQRRVLLEFAQRSMPVNGGFNGEGDDVQSDCS